MDYGSVLEAQQIWSQRVSSPIADAGFRLSCNALGMSPETTRAVSGCVQTIFSPKSATYILDKNFCQMVEAARAQLPATLTIDPKELLSLSGFVWCEDVFPCSFTPQTGRITQVNCFGWSTFLDGKVLGVRTVTFESDLKTHELRPLTTVPYCFGDSFAKALELGRSDSTKDFTPLASGYEPEVRLVFAALHIMGAKLALVSTQSANRSSRRRMDRNGTPAHHQYRLVTIRRRSKDPNENPEHHDVDWSCQWIVSGFWREQYIRPGVHKTIWVDSYTKGPSDKPFKPPTPKLFLGKR